LLETPAATPIFEALERAGFPRRRLAEMRVGRMHYASAGSAAIPCGWKLHVSSRVEQYEALVSTLLADAAVRAVPFKLAADAETVAMINGGLAGDTQVGKIVTFYPESDAVACALGERLVGLLGGWPGPVIENELRLQPHAPVFTRYGSFARRVRRSQLGLQMDVIESPTGELVCDVRGVPLHEALSVACPFSDALLASAPKVIAERFVLVGLMVETLHSKILHAIDLQACDTCLVKLVRRHTSVSRCGRDAADRLRAEYDLLSELRMPELTRVRAFHMADDWAALAMTRSEGRDLLDWRQAAPRGAASLLAVAANVVKVLCALHERTVIFGDINLRNIMVSETLEVSFVDLELASRAAEHSEAAEFGTHGYRAPGLVPGARVTYQHDLYALAGVLFYLASGMELWSVPRSDELLRDFGAELPEPWRGVQELLLRDTSGSSVETLREARARLLASPPSADLPCRLRPRRGFERADLKRHVQRTAQAIVRLAQPDEDGHPVWVSRHPTTRGQHYADLHLGDAGIALALLRIGLSLESLDLIEVAIRAGLGLVGQLARPGHESLPGLFVGDGGAALLFLSLHEVLGTDDWLARAMAVSRKLASSTCPSPDLLHGTAGLGLLQIWIYEYTRDPADLAAALASAGTLLAAVPDSGDVGWVIPDAYGDLGGQQLHGMAHGTAGVAYFLNELLRVHPEAPVASLLYRSIESLGRARAPNPRIGAVDWLHAPGGEFRGGVWCHGAAGIAQALARIYQRTRDPELLLLVEQATHAALLQSQWLGPTQCHGLAGLIEVLLDVHRATGNEELAAAARSLGAHLMRYYTEETEFGPLTSAERHDVFTPEFMVGASGAAASLARLLDVDRWGSLLLPPRDAYRPIHRA
jgi:serine/threonine protein kinase